MAALAAGRVVRAVWENAVGGLTFEVGTRADAALVFVKWVPWPHAARLDAEVARLAWAAAHTRVPRVVDRGDDRDGAWIVTSPLPGEHAAAPRWRDDPRVAVHAVGAALRAFHDALPVASCPFTWSAADRVRDAGERAAAGAVDPAGWHEEHRNRSVGDALATVAVPPPVDRLVVAHGDACLPNTLVGSDGRATGHVDLGSLGVADRWADLAVATWSATWNVGPGWERALLDAYGVEPDPVRSAYYRLLWDLGP